MNHELKVRDLMTPTPRTIGEDIPLSTAIEVMRKAKVRHLPAQYGGRIR